MKTHFAVLFVCLGAMTGCGGGKTATTTNSLSGNWQLALTNSKTGSVKSESGFFIQSGNALTGNVLLGGQSACPGVGSAQGQVNGSNVQITINQVGETVNLTGTTASGGSQVSGNYSLFSSPCGLNQFGTFTANRVTALTGSLNATFTSTTTAGLVMTLAGTITQGPNNGQSSTTLSGSMASSNGPCLSNVTIAGQISGTSVVFNLLAQDGTSLGQYVGTTTVDASSITGTYDVFPQSTGGCQDSGSGTFTIT